MPNEKHFSMVKPTLDSPLHIDFSWWKQNDSNWRIFLFNFLCDKHRNIFKDQDDNVMIDYVDPETAEVKHVDGLLYTLMNHCARQEEFISNSTSLVSTVFRIFLSNGNEPLTSRELATITGKSATIILRTFSSPHIFKGIRLLSK